MEVSEVLAELLAITAQPDHLERFPGERDIKWPKAVERDLSRPSSLCPGSKGLHVPGLLAHGV